MLVTEEMLCLRVDFSIEAGEGELSEEVGACERRFCFDHIIESQGAKRCQSERVLASMTSRGGQEETSKKRKFTSEALYWNKVKSPVTLTRVHLWYLSTIFIILFMNNIHIL